MQNLKKALTCLLLMSCLASLGCTAVQVGGQVVKREIVIMHPGRPLQITKKTPTAGLVIDDTGDPIPLQDVGGWIAMPPDHWEAVKLKLRTNLPKAPGAPRAAAPYDELGLPELNNQ